MSKQGKIPRLSKDASQFVDSKLATKTPIREVVTNLLELFPEYGKNDTLSRNEIEETLYQRLRNRKYDNRSPSYYRIREKQDAVIDSLEDIPFADPLVQLRILDKLAHDLMDEELTNQEPNKLVKRVNAICKLMKSAQTIVDIVLSKVDAEEEDSSSNIPDIKTWNPKDIPDPKHNRNA